MTLSPHPITPDQQPRVHVSVAAVDAAGQLLLVQEQKPAVRGKWNLPGGHMEKGESILVAAARELREETHLQKPLVSLIGIYSSPAAIRFVFKADLAPGDRPAAGHEIDAVALRAFDDIRAAPDATLVAPEMLRMILDDLQAPRRFDLAAFRDCGL